MKIIYTETPTKEPNAVFRDPNVFYGVITKATEVIVEGDYPNIVEAYKAVGIEVTSESKKDGNPIEPSKMNAEQLKQTLTAKGIAFPDNAKKAELVKLLEEAGGA